MTNKQKHKRKYHRNRRIRYAIAEFKRTGQPSDWLCRQAQKDDAVMREMFPGLLPEPEDWTAKLSRLTTIYFNERIKEQFEKASKFRELYENVPNV